MTRAWWLDRESARCRANLERRPHCGHRRCICDDDYDALNGDNETPCDEGGDVE